MAEVAMPKLSDSMEEGTIIRWLIADGEFVRRGAELVEIETDKATITYEAEDEGVLKILASEGATIAVGAHIALIGAEAERNGARSRPMASPLARRVASLRGVDLGSIVGSGYQGRIVRRDVEAVVAPPPPPEPAPPPAADQNPESHPHDPAVIVALTRTQQTIARRMTESKATVPEFTVSLDVDMDAAVELRRQLKQLGIEATPSYNDFVVKAAARALRIHPRANGSYRDGSFELHARVNVGVAVAAEDALLVPTLFDADDRTLGEIAGETRRLAEAARAGKLTPAELTGGTFTVSNLGMFGIREFTAVLNPPQAAILAVGALEQKPVARDGAITVRHVMALTLTCDHRILYGADAARLLAEIRTGLEQPLRLLTQT
jgi:pyruvate dehydrogenase E2 component (dihydrolipoamide acetyltransferase)